MHKVYNVILVVGLPGSGKTTYANSIAMGDPSVIVLDDLSMNPKMVDDVDPDIHDTIIITDPTLCAISEYVVTRQCEKFWPDAGLAFQFIYFENNLDACLKNRQNDPRPGGTETFTRRLSAKYLIPEGSKVLPVWQKKS